MRPRASTAGIATGRGRALDRPPSKARPHDPAARAPAVVGIAEDCLTVPANRIGCGTCTARQPRVMQEVITMAVFAGFAIWFLKEELTWNYLAASVCLVAAVVFIFLPSR
jgi:uncharacterized protein (DUF486 family)